MSTPEVFVPSVFNVSDSAVNKVKSLVEGENNPNLKLRVFVTGGGCSGFQYGFTFDEEVGEEDTVVERDRTSWLANRATATTARRVMLSWLLWHPTATKNNPPIPIQ